MNLLYKNPNIAENIKPIIIVCCIPPQIDKTYSENINGTGIFVGSNEERSMYTEQMNLALQQGCIEREFLFFNYYEDVLMPFEFPRMLNISLSDDNCHIKKNGIVLKLFSEFIREYI
jgi:hypothetical protein